jgi:type III pantothenate kinase
MILAVDIGNSDITLGLSKDSKWLYIWRIASTSNQPELYYGIKLREYFFEAGLKTEEVRKVVISSVVPGLTNTIISVVTTLFERKPIVLGPDVYQSLPIEVLNPYEIGSDLVSNALAAYTKFKGQCIIVDFGTALTFTTVGQNGKILGVAIAPGLKTAIRSLSQNTAKLFDVPLEFPTSVLGKNTVHAIQAGILLGYDGLVRSMLERIKNELGDQAIPSIVTGGLSSVIVPLHNSFTAVEPHLTLDGLKIVGEING